MKACPNCGRPTARTRDWACQWCGYPLLSGGYKELPETYRELKEKTKPEEESPVPELLEAEVDAEAETVAEPQAEVKVEVEPEPEPEAEPEPVLEAEPKPKSKAKVKPAAEPEPALEVEVKREPEPEPEPVAEAETEPEPGAPLSVDFLYSRLQADREATEAKYMNQVLKVTGLVYRTIINENLTVAYVILAGTKRYGEQQVTCAFDTKHAHEIRRLNGRDPVTVQGTYDGYAATILMRDCELVQD